MVNHADMKGWIDVALMESTNQSQSHTLITRKLPRGGFTVLECQPRTNNPVPSVATVTWLRNNVPLADGAQRHRRLDQWRLLVQNFTLEGSEKEAVYQCVVAGLQYFNQDLLKMYKLVISEGKGHTRKIV